MTLTELQDECKKRQIKFNTENTIDQLIALIVEDDNTPTDWGKIYARVLYHTGMGYEEISRRTIPQIEAILGGAEENIPIKLGIPNMLGSTPETPKAEGPPKLSQFAAIANMFNGI